MKQLTLFFILTLLAPTVYADDWDDAMTSHSNGEYNQSMVATFTKYAEQGAVDAQFNLAIMYRNGKGVKKNYAEATKWLRKAAAQGEAKAANTMGNMYVNGEGVRQNNSAAKEWFGKACDYGSQVGCSNYRKANEAGY